MSIPRTRRRLRIGKRCPRSGWNGCVIAAEPNGALLRSAVRFDRPDGQRSCRADGCLDGLGADLRGRLAAGAICLLTWAQRAGGRPAGAGAHASGAYGSGRCGPERVFGSRILMLLSTTHFGNFAIQKLSKLPQRFQIIRKQVALSGSILFNNNRAVVDPVADPVPGYVQFFG